MKMTKMLVVGLLLGAQVLSAADEMVEVKTVHGFLVKVSTQEVVLAYKKIVEAQAADLDRQLEVEKQLYLVAQSYDGFRLSSTEARSLAERVGGSLKDVEDVKTLRKVFDYAVSYEGLRLAYPEALAFAESLIALPGPAARLSTHKKAFAFASSYEGMRLSLSEAKDYADKKAGLSTK